jgi:hypothetical protein
MRAIINRSMKFTVGGDAHVFVDRTTHKASVAMYPEYRTVGTKEWPSWVKLSCMRKASDEAAVVSIYFPRHTTWALWYESETSTPEKPKDSLTNSLGCNTVVRVKT